MANKFEKLAKDAHHLTDEQFKIRFSSLTKLSDEDTIKIIKDSGISKEDLAALLMLIRDTIDFNNKTNQSILQITGGVQALASIVKKLIL